MILTAVFVVTQGVEPLSTAQQSRLSTVVDGLDSRGDGFEVLIEDVSSWDEVSFEVLKPPIKAMLNDPEAYRGEVFVLEGVLEQAAPLGPPWGHIGEWFVRTKSGELCVVYIVGNAQIKNGTQVVAVTRFYKTMTMLGRDLQHRLFPTFVTSSDAIQSKSIGGWFSAALLSTVIFLGFIVFWLQRINMKKARRYKEPAHIKSSEVLDAISEVHHDLERSNADALATLYIQGDHDS